MILLSLGVAISKAQRVYTEESTEGLKKALANYYHKGGEKANYLDLLYRLGLTYIRDGYNLQARDTLIKALQIKADYSGKNDSTYSNILTSYGESLMNVGLFDKAKDALVTSLQLNRDIHGEMSHQVIKSLNNLANLFTLVGSYRRSLDLYQTALSISLERYGSDHTLTAECLSNVGGAYLNNGDLELALKYVNNAKGIYLLDVNHTKSVSFIETLEKEGMIYEIMGELDKAEKIFLRTYKLKQNHPGVSANLVLETLNNLGILYRDLGNHEKAVDYFSTARDKASSELGNNHYYYATLTNNLAGLMHMDQKYEEALKYYLEASGVFKKHFGTYNTHYATSLNNIAGVHRLLGNYARSKELYLQVIEIDKAILGEEHPDYAKVINNLGILYSTMGKHKMAEPLYLQSLELRGKFLGVNHPSYASSLENLGLFYFDQEEFTTAEKYFRQAINLRVGQIGSIFPALTEKERIQFYQSSKEDIERYYSLALRLHHEKSLGPYIYDIQLSTKAIIYYASNKMRNLIIGSGKKRLIAKYNRWKAMNSRLLKYYQLGQTKLKELNIDIKAFETSIDSLEKSLAIESSAFNRGITQYLPIKWQDVQKVLKPNEAAIEIVRLREFTKGSDLGSSTSYGFSKEVNYLAVVLRYDKEPVLIHLNDGNAMEKEYYSLYRNSIQYNLKSNHSYLYYWAQIADQLAGVKRVYISPDGIYNKINPNIIYVPSTGKYVIDEMDIHYLTNTKDLVEKRTAKHVNRSARSVELFGNPDFSTVSLENVEALLNMPALPGTEYEVSKVGEMFDRKGWKTTIRKELQASEQAIKSLNSPRVLHIATHGFFLNEQSIVGDSNPLLKSGILLSNDAGGQTAGSSGGDGVLTAYEAMNLNLENTNLVVLSACETGLGEVKNGEGIYGLQRSFLVAGTEALILSLFKVDDEATSKLMELFYGYYLSSNNIFDSFKKAQLELRKTYSSPLTWGSFIVVGA